MSLLSVSILHRMAFCFRRFRTPLLLHLVHCYFYISPHAQFVRLMC